jgi:hypothetical protein
MDASDEQRRQAKQPGDHAMNTKIASFTAIALAAALVSGFVRFAPAIALPTTDAAVANSQVAAPMTASQKTRCIMPAAHWKGCGA